VPSEMHWHPMDATCGSRLNAYVLINISHCFINGICIDCCIIQPQVVPIACHSLGTYELPLYKAFREDEKGVCDVNYKTTKITCMEISICISVVNLLVVLLLLFQNLQFL